ncbi:kinase-like domain-containing protein [Gigaspora rosea]|uniref:Kinase-like domain-containing protein n=1 Tax=Gigaspora rosea TaxID=44941 RepID=A0A397W5J2_9GLOM|nr:kinase-like domain-containing protein [Gigaspora rosea]
MIFEWAERGNLRELYEKYDIPWTRKIQISRDIRLGLLFLYSKCVFHRNLRCENVFVLRDLSVKLGNFEYASQISYISVNLSGLETYIVRWMAPELIKQYIGGNFNPVHTFRCEMFSFGILLWELCYEKLPYDEWNIKQIADHALSGKREKILKRKFRNINDREIQLEFIKIIKDAWHHDPDLRIPITDLSIRLEELAKKFPIPHDAPSLLKNKELYFDGQKSGEPTSEIQKLPIILKLRKKFLRRGF